MRYISTALLQLFHAFYFGLMFAITFGSGLTFGLLALDLALAVS